jgi:SAM-dependent methyltransferase
VRNPFRPLDMAEVFPSIAEELGPYRQHFKGRVLNAGAGTRDIRGLVDGEVFNQDIKAGPGIDFEAPLDAIPVEDGFFDTVICNAVLEHVPNPDQVVGELGRVTRPGGLLYLCVPFMQPVHLDPGDYQRYTLDGLRLLVERHGFEVREGGPVHSVYVTLAWIASDWLGGRRGLGSRALKAILYPALRRKCRTSTEQVHSLASAYRVLAVRS